MNFASRPASGAWESAALPDGSGCAVWVWFRPPHAPDGVVLQVPEGTRSKCGSLSMLRLLSAIGVPPAEVVSWSLLGQTFDAYGGANPLLARELPALPAGEEGAILIQVRRSAAPPEGSVSPQGANQDLFAAIASDWKAFEQAETNMAAARQQLLGLQQRLNSLNRDLPPEQRAHADSIDKREWQDARRWLREAASQVARDLRNHDIGVTSQAGARSRFEQIYMDYVVPRRSFGSLPQVQKEFEMHRKTAQHLLSAMQLTISNAARDGEQRAQQILSRIAAKMRRK